MTLWNTSLSRSLQLSVLPTGRVTGGHSDILPFCINISCSSSSSWSLGAILAEPDSTTDLSGFPFLNNHHQAATASHAKWRRAAKKCFATLPKALQPLLLLAFLPSGLYLLFPQVGRRNKCILKPGKQLGGSSTILVSIYF